MPKFRIASYKPVVIGDDTTLASYEWVDVVQRTEEIASLLAGQGSTDPYVVTAKLLNTAAPSTHIPASIVPVVSIRRTLITSGEVARAGEATYTMSDVLRQKTDIPLYIQGRQVFESPTTCIAVNERGIEELNIDAGEQVNVIGCYIINNWSTRLTPTVTVHWTQFDQEIRGMHPGDDVTCLGNGSIEHTRVRSVRKDGLDLQNDCFVPFGGASSDGKRVLAFPDGFVQDVRYFGTSNIMVLFDDADPQLVRDHLLPTPEAWLDASSYPLCDMRDIDDVFATNDVVLTNPFRSCTPPTSSHTRTAWAITSDVEAADFDAAMFAAKIYEAATSTPSMKRGRKSIERTIRSGISAQDIRAWQAANTPEGIHTLYGQVNNVAPGDVKDGFVLEVNNQDRASTKVRVLRAVDMYGVQVYAPDTSKAALAAMLKCLPEGTQYDSFTLTPFKTVSKKLVDTKSEVRPFMHGAVTGLVEVADARFTRQMEGTNGKKYHKYEGSDHERVVFVDAFVPSNDDVVDESIDGLTISAETGSGGVDVGKLILAFSEVLQVSVAPKQRAWGVALIHKTLADMQAANDTRSTLVRATCITCAVFSLLLESDPVALYIVHKRGWKLPTAAVDAISDVSSSRYFFEHNVSIRQTDALHSTINNIRNAILASDPLIKDRVAQGASAMRVLVETLDAPDSRNNGATWASFRPSQSSHIVHVLQSYLASSKQVTVKRKFHNIQAYGVTSLRDNGESHWSDVTGLPLDGTKHKDHDDNVSRFARNIDALKVIAHPDALLDWNGYVPSTDTMAPNVAKAVDHRPHKRTAPKVMTPDVRARAEALLPSRKGAASDTFYTLINDVTSACDNVHRSLEIQRFTHRSLRATATQLRYAKNIVGTLREDRRSHWIRANIRNSSVGAHFAEVDQQCKAAQPSDDVDECQALAEMMDVLLMMRDKLKMNEFGAFVHETVSEFGTYMKFNTMSFADIQGSLEELREIDKLGLMSILENMDDDERRAFVELRDRGFTWESLLHDRRIASADIDREGYDVVDVPETDE